MIACRIMASVVKATMTNYRETVETDNTDFCC